MYDYERTVLPSHQPMHTPSSKHFSIPEARFQALQASIINRDGLDVRTVETAGVHGQYNKNPFSEGVVRPVRGNRPAQREREVVHFQREFHVGDVLKLQMHPELVKGMLVPKIQLAGLTENHDLCCEHRVAPVTSFAAIATGQAR